MDVDTFCGPDVGLRGGDISVRNHENDADCGYKRICLYPQYFFVGIWLQTKVVLQCGAGSYTEATYIPVQKSPK